MALSPFTFQQGQNFQGKRVQASPEIFGNKITTTAGIAAGGYPPTVAILAGAGTVGSITSQVGYDQAGSFILTAGTASINGGSLASVTFGQPLSIAPSAVIVDAGYTAGTFGLAVGAVSVTKSGFVVQGPAPVSAAAYLISYMVIRSPRTGG